MEQNEASPSNSPVEVDVGAVRKALPTEQQRKEALRHQEHRRRLINQGIPEDQVESHIARERYERLPPDKKVRLLERRLVEIAQGFARDMQTLRQNDRTITELMDINLRTISKIFVRLGVSREDQTALIRETQQEILAEMEKAAAENLKAEVDAAPAPETPTEAPAEATEFQ